jgi:hypothetical protein
LPSKLDFKVLLLFSAYAKIRVMKTQLERSILATLAWFNLFDWPLREREVWQYLWTGAQNLETKNFREIQKILNESENFKNIIDFKEEFYFLKGREELPQLRKRREKISLKKIKKAKWIAYFLNLIPWIKMISLSNVMGRGNFKEESDLDFFIITTKNRIWSTRFFSVSLMKILRLRPRGIEKKDKICLNFFVSENSLNLQPLALKPYDIYLTYWISSLIPLYSKDETYERFLEANQWIKIFLPNFFSSAKQEIKNRPLQNDASFKNLSKIVISERSNILKSEKLFQWLQLKIMPNNLKEEAKKNPEAVIISNEIIKLHGKKEKRRQYQEEFKKALARL